nr:MAG TPA: hypothetical protein [Caudoviricetes sp.]
MYHISLLGHKENALKRTFQCGLWHKKSTPRGC